jgi:hypothetical protein
MNTAMATHQNSPGNWSESLPTYRECCGQKVRQAKRIADGMIEVIEKAFNLPRGWMDEIGLENANVSYVGPYKPSRSYPVISNVQAAWCEAVEAYSLKDIDMWLESDAHVQGDAFAED